MATTKVYRNTTKEAVDVIGVGEIPAGEQISIVSDYHQPVVLANYPGVVEVTDEVTEEVSKEVKVEVKE